MNFKEILGHEKPITILRKSIENNSISHSYLFEGEDGIGKRLVGTIFAKTLLCEKKGIEPCDICSSCRKVDSGNHPDLFFIEPENNMIRKNQIEGLIRETTTAPFEADRKIFIIDNSHTMNMQSKNAILKTLEEPPSYINIILISSNPNSLLPTILSRVESVKFYPVESKEIEDYLINNYSLNTQDTKFISAFTKGAIGKSIEIAESDNFLKNRIELLNIIDDLLRGDLTRVFGTKDFFENNKEDIEDLLDIIIFFFRDLLIYKQLGESSLIINNDSMDILSSHSYMKSDKINDIINFIEETKININRNINYQLAIEMMLLNIGGK